MHGGSILVDSTLGIDTTFHFSLREMQNDSNSNSSESTVPELESE